MTTIRLVPQRGHRNRLSRATLNRTAPTESSGLLVTHKVSFNASIVQDHRCLNVNKRRLAVRLSATISALGVWEGKEPSRRQVAAPAWRRTAAAVPWSDPTMEAAKLSKLLVVLGWVPHHVTVGVGRYELPTYFIQRRAIVVRNGDDVALSPAHARNFFVQNDRLAVTN
jgi:hypothetical protein